MSGVEDRGRIRTPTTVRSVITECLRDFKKNLKYQWENKRWKLPIKWLVPLLMNAFSLYLCMVMLHVTTYWYVNEMAQWGDYYKMQDHLPSQNKSTIKFSFGHSPDEVSFGSLNDAGQLMLGFKEVNIKFLDILAGLFPLIWGLLTILTLELRLWTKCMLCNALLALGKGLLGLMTTVPDSAGWAACQKRLTDYGVVWMEHERSLLSLVMELLKLEIFGPHIRYCADMMYSGHTYFTCLYALGLYELTRIMFRHVDDDFWRAFPLICVSLLAVGQQLCELYSVLVSHFHYTSDVFVAVIMTMLLYTNGAICMVAKRWARYGLGHDKKAVIGATDGDCDRSARNLLQSEADVLIPICCVPFCCCDIPPLPEESSILANPEESGNLKLSPLSMIRTFCCCEPCCSRTCSPWIVGRREHLLSDQDICELVRVHVENEFPDATDAKRQLERDKLEKCLGVQMRLGEGVRGVRGCSIFHV